MPTSTDQLAVKLDLGAGASEEQADELTRALREELVDLGADVDLVDADDAPDGGKGFGLLAVGSLIVKIASSDALGNVVGALKAWVTRDAKRSVKLVLGDDSLELTGVTGAQQQQLIDEWLRKVSPKVDG